jgi:hypothetical protein
MGIQNTKIVRQIATNKQLRIPKKGGLKRMRDRLKEILKKEPGDELIRIINENNERDRAALSSEKATEL